MVDFTRGMVPVGRFPETVAVGQVWRHTTHPFSHHPEARSCYVIKALVPGKIWNHERKKLDWGPGVLYEPVCAPSARTMFWRSNEDFYSSFEFIQNALA